MVWIPTLTSHGEWRSKIYIENDNLYQLIKKLEHDRPDRTLTLKEDKEWMFIDIEVPADQNVFKTQWKSRQISGTGIGKLVKLIHQASSLIPIVVGALGTISKDARTWQEKLGIPDIIGSPQLSAKLGTAHVLRRVLAETCHKRTQETSLTGGKCEIPITIDMANCCCFETNQQFQWIWSPFGWDFLIT